MTEVREQKSEVSKSTAPCTMLFALGALLFVLCSSVEAQPGKTYRIGVMHQGGPFHAVVEGWRDGLRELGYEEGKQIVLEIWDAKGDLKAVQEAAKRLEGEKANLIFAVNTQVVLEVRKSTLEVPIVFAVGTDPVGTGLIQDFVKPGGRLTGVFYLTTDVTAKRLEVLKDILPKLQRVVTFYNPNNPAPKEAAKLAREAARHMGIQFIERHITSVDEVRKEVTALKPGEADAFFYVSDGTVTSQAQIIIDTAMAKKLPTMFQEQSLVVAGALASYGQNYREIGRVSAKYAQRIFTGANPRDLRVETVDKFEMAINLKTAKQIGLTIPPNVLARADKVIK